jgi:hypothetical protein
MTYLLDVNALVALGFLRHEFHRGIATWGEAFPPGNPSSWSPVRSQKSDSSAISVPRFRMASLSLKRATSLDE